MFRFFSDNVQNVQNLFRIFSQCSESDSIDETRLELFSRNPSSYDAIPQHNQPLFNILSVPHTMQAAYGSKQLYAKCCAAAIATAKIYS